MQEDYLCLKNWYTSRGGEVFLPSLLETLLTSFWLCGSQKWSAGQVFRVIWHTKYWILILVPHICSYCSKIKYMRWWFHSKSLQVSFKIPALSHTPNDWLYSSKKDCWKQCGYSQQEVLCAINTSEIKFQDSVLKAWGEFHGGEETPIRM